MLKVVISLEKTCDLSNELLEKYDLSTIDMEYMVGDDIFSTKTHDIVASSLCEGMRKNKRTSTSQINEDAYSEYFEELAKTGLPVLHLGFSSGLSGTIEVAKRCADKLNEKLGKNQIYVVDSLCGCSGQGLLGIYVRDFASNCEKIEELIEFVESIKLRIKHCYTVENLKYLAAGGRIKPAVALIGKLLNIKPVMYLSDSGLLALKSKVFSRKKAVATLAEDCVASLDSDFKMILVSHADCENDAKELAALIENGTKIKPVILNLGPILCCHSGPGTLSVYYVADKR